MSILRSVNKTIRILDTILEEERYMKEKFPGKDSLINIRAHKNIPNLHKTVSTIKYYYGMNYYRKRDKEVNVSTKIVEYLKCS